MKNNNNVDFTVCVDRTANRKLHDSNDGLRTALEKINRVNLNS